MINWAISNNEVWIRFHKILNISSKPAIYRKRSQEPFLLAEFNTIDIALSFIGCVLVFLWVTLAAGAIYFWVKYEIYVRSRYPESFAKLTFWSWNKFQTTANLLKPFQSGDSQLSMLRKMVGYAAWSLLAISILGGLLLWLILK